VDPDELNAYLERVLIGGRKRRPVVLAEPDRKWSQRFAHERERILAALGQSARRVEHIGSTAVPGLAAKPIVDVLVAVSDPNDDGHARASTAATFRGR
jgi:GrpB-like predicted nucleotidyltransferase (UPF0157 family)